jgi:ubiquinone/menaquinone biosynthesis C-methylase UbiE
MNGDQKMKQYLLSQFGYPRGIAGWLVGKIMSYENRERIAWVLSQLDVQPDDHVLEIGFGPGLGVEQAAERATVGFVAGVDISGTMVQQAGRRNVRGILEGRIELQQGTVADLPYEQDTFDRVFTINSLHHWSDGGKGLREARRVLKPGGLIAIAEQPYGAQSEADIQKRGDDLVAQFVNAGFHRVGFTSESLKRGPAIWVTGIKPICDEQERFAYSRKSSFIY